MKPITKETEKAIFHFEHYTKDISEKIQNKEYSLAETFLVGLLRSIADLIFRLEYEQTRNE